jgi:N-acetylglucosaminyldiphosphoundecaprenol N-acetyl-beta-D-mannosaminyltransferase
MTAGSAIPFPRVAIGGIPIHMARFGDALDRVEGLIRSGDAGYVCHVSAHGIVNAQDDPKLAAALAGATLAATDGMPLVWLGRWRGHVVERIYGPDFMRALLDRTAAWRDRECRHFFYGASEEVLDGLVRHVRETYPGACVAGGISPPFRPLEPEEEMVDLRVMEEAGADVVWVGLGLPRQELWMARNRPRTRVPLMIGVGAAFDFLAGTKPQAPRFLGAHGLEWLFRMVTEPRRLVPRYLEIVPRFLALAARDLIRPG